MSERSSASTIDEELEPFRAGKGTARFPLGEPLPEDLIRRIVEFRLEEASRK